jgi:hypothetical protein
MMIKVGDRVRVQEIPPEIQEMSAATQEIFALCLGKTFPVRDFDQFGHLELWVGHIHDEKVEPFMEQIWIEAKFVEVIHD